MCNKMFGNRVYEEEEKADKQKQTYCCTALCCHQSVFCCTQDMAKSLLALDQQGYSLPILQQLAELQKLGVGTRLTMWVITMWAMAFLRKQSLFPLPR